MGDISFRARHGREPGPGDSDQERIALHLLHTLAKLQLAGGGPHDPVATARRAALLDELGAYATAGRFPQNTETSERHPVFMDQWGTRCAVGHLMATSGAAALAARVDEEFHSRYIEELLASASPLVGEVLGWARSNGLTAEELAAIQPGYAPVDVFFLLSTVFFSPCLWAVHLTAIAVWALASLYCTGLCRNAVWLLQLNGGLAAVYVPVVLSMLWMDKGSGSPIGVNRRVLWVLALSLAFWPSSLVAAWLATSCKGASTAAAWALWASSAGPLVAMLTLAMLNCAGQGPCHQFCLLVFGDGMSRWDRDDIQARPECVMVVEVGPVACGRGNIDLDDVCVDLEEACPETSPAGKPDVGDI